MPLISISDLLAAPPKNKPSLIGNGLLPAHGLMLIVGKTGIGKSVLAGDIAMSLALGEPLFNARRRRNDANINTAYFPVHKPCKILYFDAEVNQAGLYERYQALCAVRCPGIDLGRRIEFVTEHQETLSLMSRSATNQLGLMNVRKLIEQAKPEDPDMNYVVVFDPLGDFHEVEENDSAMRLVFQNIKKLQAEFGFACIVTHHESDRLVVGPNGPVSRQGTQKSRGHSSISQVQDTVITLDREDEKGAIADIRLAWAKTRHAQKPPTGILLVDYARMYVDWYGPARGMDLKGRLAKRQEYINKYGNSSVEE
jgi:RecA-family ATPase